MIFLFVCVVVLSGGKLQRMRSSLIGLRLIVVLAVLYRLINRYTSVLLLLYFTVLFVLLKLYFFFLVPPLFFST